MELKYILKIVMFIFVLIFAVFLYWANSYMAKQRKKHEQELVVKGDKKRNKKLFRLYKITSEFKLTKGFINKLVRIYSVRIPGDYRRAREEAMKMALIMWMISFLFISVPIIARSSFYVLTCAGLAAYIICETLVSNKMEKYDLQLIKELNIFVDDVRHYYFDSKMIDESIREAKNNSKQALMKQHADKILNVIIADDLISASKKYVNSSVDYFLKKFLASSVTVEQYGDRTVNDESLYLSSLRDLKKDIQIELMRRRVIASKFSALGWISVVPFFILGGIEKFGCSQFASLKDLYLGSFGSTMKVVLFFVCIVAHYIINRLRNTVRVEFANTRGLVAIYNIGFVHKLVKKQLSRNWGKTLRLKGLLKKTGNNLNVYLFTVKRMIYCVCAFVFAVCFLFFNHIHNRTAYAENIMDVTKATSGASDEQCFQMLILTKYYLDEYLQIDARKSYNFSGDSLNAMEVNSEVEQYISDSVLNKLNTEPANITEQAAFLMVDNFLKEFSETKLTLKFLQGMSYEQALAMANNDVMVKNGVSVFRKMVVAANKPECFRKNPEFAEEVAMKVAERVRKVQNQYFKWYDLLLSLLISILCYNVPYLLMLFEKKFLQMDMEDEIIQFESIILILMYIKRMTVEQILDWMCMFGRIFKPSLQKCISTFPLDDVGALDQLIEDEPFEPFRRLIENLKICDKVGVETAFNGLSSERTNYQESRKLENELTTEKNANLATNLAFAPLKVTLYVYVVAPIMIAAFSDMAGALTSLQETTAT